MLLAYAKPEQVAIAGFREIHWVFWVFTLPTKPFPKVFLEPTVIIVFSLDRREGLSYSKYKSIQEHAS